MTSGHPSRVESREVYLANAAEFIRLAQETRQRIIDSTAPSMTDSYDTDLLVSLAQVNIAMAAELRADTEIAMGRRSR